MVYSILLIFNSINIVSFVEPSVRSLAPLKLACVAYFFARFGRLWNERIDIWASGYDAYSCQWVALAGLLIESFELRSRLQFN